MHVHIFYDTYIYYDVSHENACVCSLLSIYYVVGLYLLNKSYDEIFIDKYLMFMILKYYIHYMIHAHLNKVIKV